MKMKKRTKFPNSWDTIILNISLGLTGNKKMSEACREHGDEARRVRCRGTQSTMMLLKKTQFLQAFPAEGIPLASAAC